MNKKVDKVDKVHQLATLEMREQIDHECRDKVRDFGTCSGKDTRKRKPSLQAIDTQLLDAQVTKFGHTASRTTLNSFIAPRDIKIA